MTQHPMTALPSHDMTYKASHRQPSLAALAGVALTLAGLALPAWAAPTVSLTAPTNGALYLAPATFAVKANAAAAGVGVNRVEFYANGTLINTDTTSPYQFDWTNVAAGSYGITAKAIDNNGAETTSAARTVTVSGNNTAPTVSLSTPANNATYLNPATIAISATASGPELNDIIQKVEFYLNGTLVNTITQAPFSYSASNLAASTYTLTAVATDSQGAQTTSAARTFTVSDSNTPPTAAIVTPLDNSSWNSPATVVFQASANAGEANDTVRVEFYVNGSLVATDTTSPFSTNLNLSAGTYTLTATAIDGQNAQTTSAARTITVSDTNNPPTVTITAPGAGTNYPAAPAGFTLTATAGAGESNGWVQRVEFYVNGVLVNTDTAGPFSTTVSGLANGSYTLTAKAVDQLNAETTSAPITITVGPQAQVYFIYPDHLGTARLITNTSGQVVWRNILGEPFGNSPPEENPSGLGVFKFNLGPSGYYKDKETQTYYAYFRDCYDPQTGRFCEADPIGLAGGSWSLYSFVNNNPLSFTDPSGLAGGPPARGTYYPRGQMPRPPVMTPRESQEQLLNDISDFLDPSNPNFGKPIPGWPSTPKPVCRLICPSDTPMSCPAKSPPGFPKKNILTGEACTEVCDGNPSLSATPR